MQWLMIHDSGPQRAISYKVPGCVLAPFQHPYKWVVTLHDNAGRELASSRPMYFGVANPVRTSPAHQDSVPSATPVLRWNAGPGARFDVRIHDGSGANPPVHWAKNVAGNSYQVPAGVLRPGTSYAWTVHPASCATVTSYGTQPYCFYVGRTPGDRAAGWGGQCTGKPVDKP